MNVQLTLGEIAERIPAATTVMRKYHLDFCCGGKKTLEEACKFQNLDLEKISSELSSLEQHSEKGEWGKAPLDSIIDHLVNHFHARHKMMLPELHMLAAKVERVHAEHAECPVGLAQFLEEMTVELFDHMNKEEVILFPMINSGRGAQAVMPITVMTAEHDQHGQNLAKLRVLAFDFNPPEGACGTWRALYKGLDQLEHELMEHIHLENHVLFERAKNS